MAYFRDSGYTQAFRAMFDRKPPYTLHNLRRSLEARVERLKASRDAGFAQRTQFGVPAHERLALSPAISGRVTHPETDTGRIVDSAT